MKNRFFFSTAFVLMHLLPILLQGCGAKLPLDQIPSLIPKPADPPAGRIDTPNTNPSPTALIIEPIEPIEPTQRFLKQMQTKSPKIQGGLYERLL
ncbi:hypothetical protein WDW86_09220 [Bdellovibrionota bacterium FG-2]